MNEIFEQLSEFRKILCVCPCCGDIVRVSDLQLSVKKPQVKTWLDTYEAKLIALGKKEDKFNDAESKIREKAVERGRIAATKIVNTAIFPAFRAMKLNPFDVKPVLHPIDFVVFDGMTNKEKIERIIFLSRASKIQNINTMRKQVKDVIEKNHYSWHFGRIDDTGKLTFE